MQLMFRRVLLALGALVVLGILMLGVMRWRTADAQSVGSRILVTNTSIVTTTSLTLTTNQTFQVQNEAATTALILIEPGNPVEINGQLAGSGISEASDSVQIPAGATITLRFPQAGTYHILAANAGQGTETITVTA